MRLDLKPFVGTARGWRRVAFSVGLLAAAVAAQSQTQIVYTFNDKLNLAIGVSADLGGTFGFGTNVTDPFGPGLPLINGDYTRGTTPTHGTHLFLRVDGGIAAGGYDYIFGDVGQTVDATTGIGTEGGRWITSPVRSGNYLTAVWITNAVSLNIANGSPAAVALYNPRIQISLNAALINDTARFQFSVSNLDGRQHRVQLAFVEDINANQVTTVQPAAGTTVNYNSPLRIPNKPNVTTEMVYSSGQVPAYWETYYQEPTQNAANPVYFQSVRGTVLPVDNSTTEPTAPVQFAYGDSTVLNYDFAAAKISDRYASVWNFVADPTVVLFGPTASAVTKNAAVGLYYGLTTLVPNGSTQVVAYVGQDTSNSNLTPPLGLSVTSLPTLEYASGKAQRFVASTSTDNPNYFPITAYVANEADISSSYAAASQTATVTLTLPSGLKIADSTSATQTVSLPIGTQTPVTWLVTVNPTPTAGFQAGTQTYSVTATSNVATAIGGVTGSTVAVTRTVHRSIEIPAPLNFTLRGTGGINNQYRMISFPFSSNNKTPSATFRLNSLATTLDPNSFSILQYDPTAQKYFLPRTITPGQGYWIRLNTINDAKISVDPTQVAVLTAQSPAISYAMGWNQIANPYLYGIKFSDITVKNTNSGATYTMDQATTTAGLILPTVYHFDATDSNQANWGYSIEANLGFTVAPFEGYWVYFNSSNLQLVYPYPDAPLSHVTQ